MVGSVKGATREMVCTVCGEKAIGSMYANPKTFKCTKCKKGSARQVQTNVPIQETQTIPVHPGVVPMVGLPQPTDIQLEIFRNRSEMEARITLVETGEFIDRIPVKWKSRENALDYLSVSKIQAYEQCPACFYRQYMADEGLQDDNGNFYTKFGSILHEVVEKASQIFATTGLVFSADSLYDEAWKARDLTEFGPYVEGKELIRDYFKRNPVDKRSDKCLGVEYEWRGQLGGTTFGLMVDYMGQINEDTGIIKDYKSNRMPFTPDELKDSLQLRIYTLVCKRHIFPQFKNWIVGYELFRYGWQQCPPWTEDDLLDAEAYVADIDHQIRNDNTWEEKLNNYCGYRKCRLTCKTYADYVSNPKRYIDLIHTDSTDLAAMERDRELLTTYEKVAKTRKDELAGVLKTAIQDAVQKGQSLVIDGMELQLYSNGTGSYRYYDTKNVMLVNGSLNEFDKCLTVSKTKLDKIIKDKPQLALALANCMDTNYASPYIIKSKYKPKA